MIGLAAAFFVTALLYASVGFGGGSTYNALLALAEVDYRLLPAVALLCNVVVVTGGTIRFARAGLLPWKRAVPLVVISAPFAWAGGLTPIKEATFLVILAVSLFVSGLVLLFQREVELKEVPESTRLSRGRDLLTGAGIGYLAGLVGIGGGIFLAPYLHFTRWANARAIAATASFFILVNSLAGLAGQASKLIGNGLAPSLLSFWPLIVSVFIGGQIGSHLGINTLPPRLVRRATAILVLYVAAQLAWKLAKG